MQEERRKIIVHNHLQNPFASARKLGKLLGYPKSTVARVIKRYKETLTTARKVQTKRRSGTFDRQLRLKVIRKVKDNPNISDYDLAKKLNADRCTVRRIRLREGYKCYRASRQPNRTLKQQTTARSRARRLYDRLLTKREGCLLLDDETYVKADFQQIPGVKFYKAPARGKVPGKYKFIFADKFAKKFMIWQGICSCGKKTSVFVTNKTMNSEVYTRECLKKRVLPFIKSHDGPVTFWPDLASCHYSKDVVQWYNNNGVQFIPKELNPPNCPQFRPIEKYWAIMKRKLKMKGAVISDLGQMKNWWNRMAKTVTEGGVRRLMRGINGKVREFLRIRDE